MKNTITATAALLLALGANAEETLSTQGVMEIAVTNIEHKRGTLYVAVYDSPDHWLDANTQAKPFREASLPVSSTEGMLIAVTDLPPGNYAVSLFHDLDEDAKLDTNFIGYPKEPFGFSAPMSTFGPPKFEEAAVQVSGAATRVEVSLSQ